MGSWGPGNFDNDAARDHLFDLTRGLADEIEQALDRATAAKLSGASDGDVIAALEIVLPNIDILCVLHESLDGGFLPEPVIVDDWQSRFEQLNSEREQNDDLEAAKRREVIVATFDKLRQFAQQCWEE